LRLAEEQVEVFSAALVHKLLLAQELARTKKAAEEEAKKKAEEEAAVSKKRADQEAAEKAGGWCGEGGSNMSVFLCLYLSLSACEGVHSQMCVFARARVCVCLCLCVL
jgi:hypothetical protein